jgi:hypothetical protein
MAVSNVSLMMPRSVVRSRAYGMRTKALRQRGYRHAPILRQFRLMCSQKA